MMMTVLVGSIRISCSIDWLKASDVTSGRRRLRGRMRTVHILVLDVLINPRHVQMLGLLWILQHLLLVLPWLPLFPVCVQVLDDEIVGTEAVGVAAWLRLFLFLYYDWNWLWNFNMYRRGWNILHSLGDNDGLFNQLLLSSVGFDSLTAKACLDPLPAPFTAPSQSQKFEQHCIPAYHQLGLEHVIVLGHNQAEVADGPVVNNGQAYHRMQADDYDH